MAEQVGDNAEHFLFADRAVGLGQRPDIRRRSDEFWMGVAYLGLPETTDPHLVDEHAARQPMINDSAPGGTASQSVRRESHCPIVSTA